ncbi:MAG: choice-of-anchor V domain-containing protein [bacterium]
MKMFVTSLFALVAIIAIMSFEILSPDGKAGYSGSPGEGNCTSCHSGTVNSGTATCAITSEPSLANGYTAGAVYTISCTISNSPSPNHKRFGVDAEVLLGSGANAGTISITNATMTKIKTNKVGANTRNNVCHTGSMNTGPSTQTFSFQWTAPATGSGTSTVYASLMAANNDGGTSGDKVYTVNLPIQEASVSVTQSNHTTNLSIFPNPSNGRFQVGVGDAEISANSSVEIFNSEGKMIYKSSINNTNSEVDLSNKPAGIYFVKVFNGSIIQSGKAIISL